MATQTTAHKERVNIPVEHEIRFWMRAPAITINLAAPLSEALALMREHDIRRLPVVIDTGELRGFITQGDIRGADVLRAAGLDPFDIGEALRRVKVYEIMSDDPITITAETSLREAAMLMIENKIGGLPVVDDANMVVGIVTESDLFRLLIADSASADQPDTHRETFTCQHCGTMLRRRSFALVGPDDECWNCHYHLHRCGNCRYFDGIACMLGRIEQHTAVPGRHCPTFSAWSQRASSTNPMVVEEA